MQPLGHAGDVLSNRLHISVLTVRESLPDLANHVPYLGSRADTPTPANNDGLTGVDRHLEAGSVPVRHELLKLRRTRMLRKCRCLDRQSSREKHRSPERTDNKGPPRRVENSRGDPTVCNACND